MEAVDQRLQRAGAGDPSPAALVLGHTLTAARRTRGLTRRTAAHDLRTDERSVTRLEGALAPWPAHGFPAASAIRTNATRCRQ
jgi:hypothetical protein